MRQVPDNQDQFPPVGGELAAFEQILGETADRDLCDQLSDTLPLDWRCVASCLAPELRNRCRQCARPLLVGLSGGQGAGKSTLALALEVALGSYGLTVGVLSLDDVYHTRATRRALADEIHPLLATRGVPGTHDLALLESVLDAPRGQPLRLPRFDKGQDDRAPMADWPALPGVPDILLLDGWCLGVEPQDAAELRDPVNELEQREDPDGRYRRYINDEIASAYTPLWRRLDAWLFLAVPSFRAVVRWRTQQEESLAPAQRMTAGELKRFCDHYERLTHHLLGTAPNAATWTLKLAENHRVKFREGSAARS
ncbi:MAG: hypothetical protein AAF648_12350 [Pseudomonadota bacterium]